MAVHWGSNCDECNAEPIFGTLYADFDPDARYCCCSECYISSACEPAQKAVLEKLQTFDETLDALFASFDSDSDGFLSKSEVSQPLHTSQLMWSPV